MLLLLGSAFLFWLIISVIGRVVCNCINARQGLLVEFMTGFVVATTIFNCISFFSPVNYWLVISALLIIGALNRSASAIIIEWKTKFQSLKPINYLLLIPFVFVLILNALLPPQHGDSQGYHFLTALWIETYKIIPGLANIHGRFGFNSSFFTSTAAFSFTKISGQAIYSVNVVFIGMFYGWLLNRVFTIKNYWYQSIYLIVALFMFRALFIGMNSPMPDSIASIIVVFIFIRLIEDATNIKNILKAETILIICLAAFALTVKLNTVPLILPAIYLFICKQLYKEKKIVLLLSVIIAIIVLPWLIRNYIISGYFAYPVAFTGFLHPEWQIPLEALKFDKILINNGPKLISEDWEMLDQLTFFEWFPKWVLAHKDVGALISLSGVFVALLCGAFGLIYLYLKKNCRYLLLLSFHLPGYYSGYLIHRIIDLDFHILFQ